MDCKSVVWIFLVVFIVIFLIVIKTNRKEDFTPSDTYGYPYYFQNLPPTLALEDRYHICAIKECGGDYENVECLQRCYVLSMKNGTSDRADLICHNEKHDLAKYVDCMDGVYSNYKNLDRSTGITSCPCPDGTTSYIGKGGGCVCRGENYPLKVRLPTDESGELKPFSVY